MCTADWLMKSSLRVGLSPLAVGLLKKMTRFLLNHKEGRLQAAFPICHLWSYLITVSHSQAAFSHALSSGHFPELFQSGCKWERRSPQTLMLRTFSDTFPAGPQVTNRFPYTVASLSHDWPHGRLRRVGTLGILAVEQQQQHGSDCWLICRQHRHRNIC